MYDMVGQYIQKKEEEKQIEGEQAAKTRYWKIPVYYDDDDEDYTIAITHKEPDNSLSMGDEHLDTISATESDEFIKSSVKNLVPNPKLLSNNSLSLPENESFHFDIPSSSRPPAKPPDGNSGNLNVKVMGGISEHKVPMPRLMPTIVPNQEKSPNLLSNLGHEAF
uniref:Uncharacterized protein n=1 Tax=Tanacetum cinerariifolium TaxID=118510 RepID=A0A6L2KZG2_TANCI|nr:hypothetical protein [Tanacetum cinerariifolium]